MKTDRELPVSRHFRLEQLGDGVYAAIHRAGGGAIGNAGIVDLGDRTLVYDTFIAPLPAEDLRRAAEALTGRFVDTVINSHWHSDHIWGNQVFGRNTDILSTEETRRLIVAKRDHGGYQSEMASAEADLDATRARFEAAQDEGQRRELALWIDEYQSVVEAKPILQVRAPNLAFSQHLAFHGTQRSAELTDFIGGHTKSDALLFLPQEGIAFMGDLLFVECHPWLGGCDPDKLPGILDAISGLAPKVLVPGHGPVGTADSLVRMKHYVNTLDGLARKMVEQGEAEERIDAMPIPEPYCNWLIASFFSGNMHFLYQRHSRKLAAAAGSESLPSTAFPWAEDSDP